MSNSTLLPVFVYGTLRSGLGNYQNILAGHTASEAPAALIGATMRDAGGCPFVTIEGTGTVVGEIMHLDPAHADDTMLLLDRLEGYQGPNHPGNMYERVTVEVLTHDLTMVTAYTYVTGAGVSDWSDNMPVIATGDWKNRRMAATV